MANLRLFLIGVDAKTLITRTSSYYATPEEFAQYQIDEYSRRPIAWEPREAHPENYTSSGERAIRALLAIWEFRGTGEFYGRPGLFIDWLKAKYPNEVERVKSEAADLLRAGVSIAPAKAGPRKPPPQVPAEVWRDAYKLPAFDPAQAWDALQAVCKGQRGS